MLINSSSDTETEPELIVGMVEQRGDGAGELGALAAERALQRGAHQPVRVRGAAHRPLVRAPLVRQCGYRPTDGEPHLGTVYFLVVMIIRPIAPKLRPPFPFANVSRP